MANGYTDQADLPSNEDIQHTLTDLGEDQVISYVDYFPNVRQISLFDEHVLSNMDFSSISIAWNINIE